MGTIVDKLNKLLDTKEVIKNAIIEKGQPVSDNDTFASYANKILDIQTGIQLPELTNPGSASDLMQGKQLIDEEGNSIEGTFTIDSELSDQSDLITDIQTVLSTKMAVAIAPTIEVSESGLVTATSGDKTVTHQLSAENDPDLIPENIISGATIFGVEGNASIAETPTISINTSGQITATAAGKSATHKLSSADDVDFIANNIKEGVNIFGVLGTLTAGSGNWVSTTASLTGTSNHEIFLPSGLGWTPKSFLAICKQNETEATASSHVPLMVHVDGHRQIVLSCKSSNYEWSVITNAAKLVYTSETDTWKIYAKSDCLTPGSWYVVAWE